MKNFRDFLCERNYSERERERESYLNEGWNKEISKYVSSAELKWELQTYLQIDIQKSNIVEIPKWDAQTPQKLANRFHFLIYCYENYQFDIFNCYQNEFVRLYSDNRKTIKNNKQAFNNAIAIFGIKGGDVNYKDKNLMDQRRDNKMINDPLLDPKDREKRACMLLLKNALDKESHSFKAKIDYFNNVNNSIMTDIKSVIDNIISGAELDIDKIHHEIYLLQNRLEEYRKPLEQLIKIISYLHSASFSSKIVSSKTDIKWLQDSLKDFYKIK